MDPALLAVAQHSFHLNPSYVSHALQHSAHHQREVHSLLQHRRIPPHPWPDPHILSLLSSLSSLDSNTFHPPCGAGEREGRVFSPLVSARHFSLSHGVGRSGALTGQQPKAIGSSLLSSLASALALDAARLCGLRDMEEALILPVATGLSITLALLALASSAPSTTRVVLLPRIDQRTCVKAITQANLTPLLLPLEPFPNASHPSSPPDSLSLSPSRVLSTLDSLPPGSVLAVLSVTSCFSPRLPDDVVAIARLCAQRSIGHVINNAYGLQSPLACAAISRACRVGRVDLVVQSLDKNFLVPVSGAVVCSPASVPGSPPSLLRRISALYPGRASSSAHTDLLITLLAMGASGLRTLLDRRSALFLTTRTRLASLATRHGERLLDTPGNDVSLAMTVTAPVVGGGRTPPHLGAMLYSRGVSGCKLYEGGKREEVGGVVVEDWGGHGWQGGRYLTVAVAIGMTEEEVDRVLHKLDQCLKQWKRKAKGSSLAPSANGGEEAEEAPEGEEEDDAEAKSAELNTAGAAD